MDMVRRIRNVVDQDDETSAVAGVLASQVVVEEVG